MVVIYHAAASTEQFVGPLPSAVKAVCDRLYLGVDFFFVLSGFIIVFVNQKITRSGLAGYVRSRLVRVFLPYWPVGVGLAIAYTLLPAVSQSNRAWSWFTTLTLMPSRDQSALIVAWTLQYELTFYLIFALGVLVRRPIALVLLWAFAIIIANLFFPADEPAIWLAPIALEFSFGLLAAVAIIRSWRLPAVAPACALLLTYLAVGAEEAHRLLFGAAMGFVILAVVRREAVGLRVPQSLVFLGAASYAIYLVHNPIIALTARLMPSWPIAMTVCILVGTAAGVAFHLIYEVPVLRLFQWRALIDRKPGGALEGDPSSGP